MNLITPNGTGQWKRRPYNPYREINAYTDETFRLLEEEGRTVGIEIVCKPGCAACCTYYLGAFDTEAEAIADYLESQPKQKRETIKRLVGWIAAWDQQFPDDHVGDPSNVLKWQAQHIACPMLDLSTNLCTVYDVRPGVCRTFHATCSERSATRTCTDGVCPPQQEAPDACWTQPHHVEAGHLPWIFMLRPDLNELLMPMTLGYLQKHRSQIGYGSLIHFILEIGKRKYGWTPGSFTILPVLTEGVIDASSKSVSDS